jgi:succinoglycan biosynthesis protein ExoL
MGRKNILFLLSHQPNPRFVKQINFLSVNHNVSVLYYYRVYMKDLSVEYSDKVVLNESLGTIINGNYLKRISVYCNSFKQLKNILKVNSYDTLIVNNIDTLALFKLSSLFQNIQTEKIIEISDLRGHAYTSSIKSNVMKSIEKFMFKYVDKLIVTSPKFYNMYYNTIFKDEPFILENKPLSNMIPNRLEKVKNDKIVIGIVGLLLQGKPYQSLFEAIKDNDRYEVHIYGKGIFENLVKEYADKYNNIKFFGEYNFFKDSAKIYSTLDILYMPYDTTNGSLNNKIALPNKLYEAIYFQVPIITSKDTYLGELVEKYDIGMTIKCCDNQELLKSIKSLYIKEIKDSFIFLDKSKYIADDDYKELEKYVLH